MFRAACNVSVTSCISCSPSIRLSLAFVGRVLAQSLVAEFAVPGTALPMRDSQNFGWLCNTFRGATNLVKSSGHVDGNENKNNIIMTTQDKNPLDRSKLACNTCLAMILLAPCSSPLAPRRLLLCVCSSLAACSSLVGILCARCRDALSLGRYFCNNKKDDDDDDTPSPSSRAFHEIRGAGAFLNIMSSLWHLQSSPRAPSLLGSTLWHLLSSPRAPRLLGSTPWLVVVSIGQLMARVHGLHPYYHPSHMPRKVAWEPISSCPFS